MTETICRVSTTSATNATGRDLYIKEKNANASHNAYRA